MTWLYSLVLAGLMFTSGSDLKIGRQQQAVPAPAAVKNSAGPNSIKFDETDKFEQTYPLDANGTVSVSNVNGSIVIEAWDNPQVKLEVIKVADSRDTLNDVDVRVDARPNTFRVETDYDNGKNSSGWKNGRKLEVNFHLTVPRSAVLNEIETVNGSVTVSNFTNYTKVSAVNGEVKATNLRGNASLSTVNGTVEADYQSLESVKKISLETVNGKVFLTVPSDVNATLKADSLNGEITNDFGLPVRKGQYVGRDLYGKIGSGEIQVRMSSVNGELSFKRRSDGKNTNPAVNLLQQKGKVDADDDADDDADVDFDNDKMDADIAKSIADSQKEVAKAMKETAKANKAAQKELKNIQPQLNIELDSIRAATKIINSEEIKAQIAQAVQVQKNIAMQDGAFNWAWSPSKPAIEKKSESFTVKGTPKVTIDAKGCTVIVRGWDKPEVSYSLKKFSKMPNQGSVDAKTSQNGSDVTIQIGNAAQNGKNNYFNDPGSSRLEVFVPKKSDLKITTDGEIRLEGVTGDLDLDGQDESINVRDSGGKLRVAAADGLVRVVGFKGELDSKTEDGRIFLEGDFQKLSAVTGDGEIILTLPENADADIESNIDEIAAEGISMKSEDGDDASNYWKIGRGGTKYRLISEADGKITIRGKNTLLAAN